MSHIDSFEHEIVGQFGGLPVYHPLQEIDGDFTCAPSQLLIGGGSGEHPALIIRDPTGAVAMFLDSEIATWENNALKDHWQNVIEAHVSWDFDKHFEFSDWDVRTYWNFYNLCESPALPNPLTEGDDFEEWLLLGIGEFVFFAMPDLAAGIVEKLDDPYRHFKHVKYNNIMLIPGGMPVYANGGNAFSFSRRNKPIDR